MDRRIGTRTVNKFMICPYNPAHRVEKGHRFQRHLIECAKDHKHVEEVICKFNFTHRIKAPDAAHHMMTCPDRFIVERELIHMDDKNEMQYKEKLPKEDTVLPPTTENWDDDLLSEPMTIPSIHNNKNIKFFNSDTLSGLKPAQKKKFRQNLWKGKNTWLDEEGEGEQNGHPEPAPVSQPSQQPMRLPTKQPKAAQLAPELEKLHIGRGMRQPRSVAPSRIAANIFGGKVDPLTQGQSMQYGLAGIGRGLPLTLSKAAACTSSNPTPALVTMPAMTPPSPASLPMPGLLPGSLANGVIFHAASEQFEDAPLPPRTRSPPGFSSSSSSGTRSPTHPASSNAAVIPNDNSCVDEAQKGKKKLEKKLKQIERLEEKQANGETLNSDELEKLGMKSSLLKELGMQEESK